MRSIAIVLGFLQGTWDLVDGLNRIITGRFLPFHNWLTPGAHAAWLLTMVGAGWMLAGNVFLFQSTARARSGFIAMIVVSSYYAGWLVLFPVTQLALLLLDASRVSRSSSRNGAAA
ncbi:MAG TPA: hypothetical protein VN709_02180 [Terriglobales bacterium]|nr:hypothetical protein [Terriglobales bacterium]